jgi:hypothetical protein
VAALDEAADLRHPGPAERLARRTTGDEIGLKLDQGAGQFPDRGGVAQVESEGRAAEEMCMSGEGVLVGIDAEHYVIPGVLETEAQPTCTTEQVDGEWTLELRSIAEQFGETIDMTGVRGDLHEGATDERDPIPISRHARRTVPDRVVPDAESLNRTRDLTPPSRGARRRPW